MYKFISYAEYMETKDAFNAEGEPIKIRVSPYAYSHPNARVCPDKIEVVLSCSNHKQPCGCVTHAEAVEHIKLNWRVVED